MLGGKNGVDITFMPFLSAFRVTLLAAVGHNAVFHVPLPHSSKDNSCFIVPRIPYNPL